MTNAQTRAPIDVYDDEVRTRRGTAFLTAIVPDPPDPSAIESVYAVYPLVSYPDRETAYLLVTASPQMNDTCIYPVDKRGRLIDYCLLGCVPGLDHERALSSINYEREVVISGEQ